MQKIERKHAAHAAALNNPGAASKAAFRAANTAAKAAVRRDQERYYKQQAEYAEAALRGGNLGVFHKHVQRIFGEQQGSNSAAPMSVLGGPDGKQVLQSREEVVKSRFAEHFADVLDCPTTLDLQCFMWPVVYLYEGWPYGWPAWGCVTPVHQGSCAAWS